MGLQWVENNKLNEKFAQYTHESGLKVFICPKEGYSTTMAMFGTVYGSIDTKFKKNDEEDFTVVPEGIAHYLEHKLFESDDGEDVFTKYARTGAYANAFTSFDRTCYLFSCSENFEASFDILLDFVQSPYFTPENVQKEQGIIGQEITMYQDDAQWKVFFNLLRAMYHNHPVRIDIAGTIESIAQITDQSLYQCYDTFYNLNNMFICVAGKVSAEKIAEQIDKSLKVKERIEISRGSFEEPLTVVKPLIEESLEVSQPLFTYGFKEQCENNVKTLKEKIETEVLLEIIAGESSTLYKKLYDEGLINNSFGSSYFTGFGYAAAIFQGESSDPHKVKKYTDDAINNFRETGINQVEFKRAIKKLYGKAVIRYNSIDEIAHSLVECAVTSDGLFDDYKVYHGMALNDLEQRFKTILDTNNSALSIIKK